jgi:transcriptional regulator with XRE-family HTH domain
MQHRLYHCDMMHKSNSRGAVWQRPRGAEGLGHAVRLQREMRGWTQAELAGLLGVDRTTLVRMEAGRNPALTRLMDALSLLGADIVIVPRRARVTVDEPSEDAATDDSP